jgi:signal transduction histidine kinase
LREEEKRQHELLSSEVKLQISIPDNLPNVVLEGELFHQVLAIVLENAREAISGPGVISVSAKKIELSAEASKDFYGDVRPGSHVEICITDTGTGLSPEDHRQLFQEPFFSTKPRKRGFGLAMAYGIISPLHGGLDLVPLSERGVLARIVLPVAADTVPASCESQTALKPLIRPSASERVLDIEDDPVRNSTEGKLQIDKVSRSGIISHDRPHPMPDPQ